jgi:hypothetical protein
MQVPADLPENGFYYHFKHDPTGPLNNYAYEVIGTGCNTEGDWIKAETYFVVYRPLYEESAMYQNGKLWCLRPLTMFMEDITKDGGSVPRFHKITNPEIIAALQEKSGEMYR